MAPATHYYEGSEQTMIATIDGKRYLLSAPPIYNNMATTGGKITFGDYTRDSDENSSSKIWFDFSGGIGVENIREGSDEGSYWYGYMNAKSPYQLSLPRETLTLTNVRYPLGNFGGYFWATDGVTLFRWDEDTLTFIDSTYTMGAIPVPGKCMTFDDVFWIPCGSAGVVQFNGSSNSTLDSAVKAVDLYEFDNHLYAITTDKKLQMYDGSTWASQATFLWGDTPRSLLVYMNRLEDDILYIVTDRGLVAWDKSNTTSIRTRFNVPIFQDNGRGAVVWRPGENLYYPAGMQVYQYNTGGTLPLGPGGRQGVPARVRGRIVDMEPSFNSMFALIEGASETAEPSDVASVELSNPDFDVNDDDWSIVFTDADITTTFARDAAEDASDGTGAGEFAFTANTGAQGVSSIIRLGEAVPAAEGVEFTYSAWVKVSDIDLVPQLAITWLDASDATISEVESDLWAPALNTWEEVVLVATAPADSVTAYVGCRLEDRNAAGGTTGSMWIDDLTFERDVLGAYLEGGSYYDDALESTTLSTSAMATVMEFTGSGWHPAWESPVPSGVAFSIVGSSELDHERMFWGYGTSIYTQKLSKTSALVRQQWEAEEARFASSGYIDTGWFDGNMFSYLKTADRLEVNVANVTTDSWFAVDYRIDNDSVWVPLTGPVYVADEGGTEGKIVLPFGVETINVDGVEAEFSRGLTFNRIRFRIRMETSDAAESCIIDSLVFKYIKQGQPYPLFQLSIDVSSRSEEVLGRTASEIRADLTELTRARQFSWVRLGDFNAPVFRGLITAESGVNKTGNDQAASRKISVVGYPLTGYDGLPAGYTYEP